MTSTEFHERLEARADAIVELLARSGWRLWDRRVPRNPELRKNLTRHHTAIGDARRLEREGLLADDARDDLLELLDVAPPNSSDALGAMLERVDRALVRAGDAALVCELLEIEYARDRAEGGGGVTTWTTLFSPEPLRASEAFRAGRPVSPAELAEARQKLAALYRARQSLYLLERARSQTKAMRLLWLAPVVGLLAVAVVVVADLTGDASWRTGVLVAVAGAAGATVAGALKLRDQLPRIATMRTFWYAFALQLPLGAVAGLFLWIVLESEIVSVSATGPEWARDAAVAFAAGFSEPLLLKTVERIAGSAAPKSG